MSVWLRLAEVFCYHQIRLQILIVIGGCHASLSTVPALATVAVIGFASIASAADMPVKAPVYRAPVATVYNWSGCYIGLNAGGGWARTEFTNTVNTTAFGHLDPGESFTYDNSGFVGGRSNRLQLSSQPVGVRGRRNV